MMLTRWATILLQLLVVVQAFSPLSIPTRYHAATNKKISWTDASTINSQSLALTATTAPTTEQTFGASDGEDPKSYSDILQNLQQQGFQLMGIDATDVTAFLAAVWQILADMSASDEAQSIGLIFENTNIPVSALASLEQDWAALQQEQDGRLMPHLPEVARLNVRVARGTVQPNDRTQLTDPVNGKPTLLLEARARTDAEKEERESRQIFETVFTEEKTTAAMQHFVTRLVQQNSPGATCPYTASATVSGVGLEARGVQPGPVGYRYDGTSDAVQAVSAFWACVQECLATKDEDLATILLSLPAIGPGMDGHDRFAAVVELISRNLCLFRGDGVFGLVHFHPGYKRDTIHPVDKPAYGHLPPTSWLRPMLRHNNHVKEAESMTEEDLACSDYQRRAPCTMINILRASQLDAAAGPKSIVDLQIDPTRTEKASGIVTYTRNAIRLASLGENTLRDALEEEMVSML